MVNTNYGLNRRHYGLNRRHQRHSTSDTRAVVFQNSYATWTEQLRITNTTLSPAAIFVEAMENLSASAVSGAFRV